MRDLEVLTDLYVDKMEEEYKRLFDVDVLDKTHAQAMFINRTAVAKAVKEGLTPTERRALDDEVTRRKQQGLPSTIQLR